MATSQTQRNATALTRPLLRDAPSRNLCTDCGVSRMSDPKLCGIACQFIAPDYSALEAQVHGRVRDAERADELHFGVFQAMFRARLAEPRVGAQWSGLTTRLAERLLEVGAVDAVLCVAQDPDDPWRPMPVIVTRPEDMARCRGMRMGYAPLLALLEPAMAQGHRRLAVIGIPCQVYALRALEAKLGLEALYVIGTPCSDNTTTERFHEFLALLSKAPETITYLEFCPDYHVELRFKDGGRQRIPFIQLPLSTLPADFFPLTCKTCVDYANSLSDVTVGYMGGDGEQWVLVRNERGRQLFDLIQGEAVAAAPRSAGNRKMAVKGFLQNVVCAAGGLPLNGAPKWARPLIGWLMPRIGPRGLEFARARVEMKAIETIVHLRREAPAKVKSMAPDHVWRLAKPYGLSSAPTEERMNKD